jgi:hypothetical protein
MLLDDEIGRWWLYRTTAGRKDVIVLMAIVGFVCGNDAKSRLKQTTSWWAGGVGIYITDGEKKRENGNEEGGNRPLPQPICQAGLKSGSGQTGHKAALVTDHRGRACTNVRSYGRAGERDRRAEKERREGEREQQGSDGGVGHLPTFRSPITPNPTHFSALPLLPDNRGDPVGNGLCCRYGVPCPSSVNQSINGLALPWPVAPRWPCPRGYICRCASFLCIVSAYRLRVSSPRRGVDLPQRLVFVVAALRSDLRQALIAAAVC